MFEDEKDCCFCDCYDPDMGCTMPSIDRSYACPLCLDCVSCVFYDDEMDCCSAGSVNGICPSVE